MADAGTAMRWMGVSRLRQSPFLRAVFGLSAATALAQVVQALATPLLSRLYSPEEFGVLAAFSAIAMSVLVLSSLRYEMAIPIQHGVASARHLLLSSLGINTLVAIVLLPVVHFAGPALARQMAVPELAGYLWLLPAFIFVAGIYRSYAFDAIRRRNFRAVAATKIWQATAGTVFQLIAGLAKMGSLGLIIGFIVWQGAGIFRLLRLGGTPRSLIREGVSKRRLLGVLRRHRKFPVYDVPAAAANTLGLWLPSLLLASFFGAGIAGYFAMGQRLLAAPSALLGQTVGQVLLGNARAQCDDGTILGRLNRVIGGLALVAGGVVAVLFFGAVPLFQWVLGTRWETAGVYAGWIALGAGAQLIYSPVSVLLLATEGQLANLVIQVLMLVIRIGALGLGYRLQDPLLAVQAVSVASAVGYLAATIWLVRHVAAYVARRTRAGLVERDAGAARPVLP